MKRTTAVVLATLFVTGVAWSKKPKEPAPVAEPVAEHAPAESGELAGIVRYRHTLMESMAKHAGMSKMILDGKVSRPSDLAAHADAMAALSADLVGLFPAGTGPDAYETHALPAVWERPDEFAAAAGAFHDATTKFAEVVHTGDLAAASTAFGDVGKGCGGCHEPFREEHHD